MRRKLSVTQKWWQGGWGERIAVFRRRVGPAGSLGPGRGQPWGDQVRHMFSGRAVARQGPDKVQEGPGGFHVNFMWGSHRVQTGFLWGSQVGFPWVQAYCLPCGPGLAP